MYEHPIKRAGLSLNRIIFSNTKMVFEGFPDVKRQQFDLHFRYRTFANGKVQTNKSKPPSSNLVTVFSSKNMDEVLPARNTKE